MQNTPDARPEGAPPPAAPPAKPAGPGTFLVIYNPQVMDQRIGERVIWHSLTRFNAEVLVVALGHDRMPEKFDRFTAVYVLDASGFGLASGVQTNCLSGCNAVWEHEHPGQKPPPLVGLICNPQDRNNLFLQHGLNSLGPDQFRMLCEDQFSDKPDETVFNDLLVAGKVIHFHTMKVDERIAVMTYADCRWHGLNICAINHPNANRMSFQKIAQQRHDALLSWSFNGKECLCRLWHAPTKEHINLKKLLESAGVKVGMGNRFACDFDTIKSILSNE